jgi:hypothetical protein
MTNTPVTPKTNNWQDLAKTLIRHGLKLALLWIWYGVVLLTGVALMGGAANVAPGDWPAQAVNATRYVAIGFAIVHLFAFTPSKRRAPDQGAG